jgi:RNA polymerase sigma factor (sigma-70 family)
MGTIDFNQLYSMHSKRLYYIAFQYTKDRFLAEDIVQEAFLKAYKKINTVEDTKKLGAWLAAITARTAIDFLRSEKRKNWLLIDPFIIEPMLGSSIIEEKVEDLVGILLFQTELSQTMEQLSQEYREVLILRINYGLKENEIASLLDLKSTTVKTRLYRARKHLKQAILVKESA